MGTCLFVKRFLARSFYFSFLILVLVLCSIVSGEAESLQTPAVGLRVAFFGNASYEGCLPNTLRDIGYTVSQVEWYTDHEGNPDVEANNLELVQSLGPEASQSYDAFVSSFDVIVIEDFPASVLPPLWQTWFVDAVVKSGMTLLMVGGDRSFTSDWALEEGFLPVEIPAAILPESLVTLHSLGGDFPDFDTTIQRHNCSLWGGPLWSGAQLLAAAGDLPLLVTWRIGTGYASSICASWQGFSTWTHRAKLAELATPCRRVPVCEPVVGIIASVSVFVIVVRLRANYSRDQQA